MTIKTPLRTILITLVACSMGVVLFIKFAQDYIIFALAFGGLWLVLCTRFLYTTCKTIYMDESGCTVTFLFFKQKYKWEELKTKRITYNGAKASKLAFRHYQYEKTVVFSKKENLKTSKYIDIETHYNICLKPWSYFIVNIKDKNQKASSPTYEVDEEYFMSKMKEWGVELTEEPLYYGF